MNPVCLQVDEIIRKYGIDSFDEPKRSFTILLTALLANFREESNNSQRALYKELEKRFDSFDAKLHVLCELAAQEQGFRYEARVRNDEEEGDFDLDAEKSGVSRIYRLVDESEDVRQGFHAIRMMAGTEFDHARKQLQCRETANSLHPFQPSMEINCWLYVDDGYALLAACSLNLMNDDGVLAAKLLQLEKQIVFSTAMMNRQPEFIGLTSTSDYSEEAILCRLLQFIRDHEYAEVVPFVHEFLQKGKFKPQQAP